jgi:hypothetical protein
MEWKQPCGMEDGGRPSGERITGNGRCEAPKFLGLDCGLPYRLGRPPGHSPGPARRDGSVPGRYAIWLGGIVERRDAARQSTSGLPAVEGQVPTGSPMSPTGRSLPTGPATTFTGRKYFPQPMCGGVAAIDYNNDGLMDLFFTNGAKLPELEKTSPAYYNCLLHNNGDGTFEDVTVQGRPNRSRTGLLFWCCRCGLRQRRPRRSLYLQCGQECSLP